MFHNASTSSSAALVSQSSNEVLGMLTWFVNKNRIVYSLTADVSDIIIVALIMLWGLDNVPTI